MCVIIDRQPGVTIPADKLDIACDINKHGFGIAYPKNGRLYFIRSLAEPNDPKVIADHLQKLKNERVFLHLRHATVGSVTSENNHPFHVLQHKKHGIDVAWMHNGTLYDYKPKNATESDTHLFHTNMMVPLALRIVKFSKKKVLEDDLFQWVLKKETGFSSVFFVFDGMGNTFITNKDKGKQHDGWWSSNDYSFQHSHIRASTYKPGISDRSYDPWGFGYDETDTCVPFDVGAKVSPLSTWEQDLADEDAKTINAQTLLPEQEALKAFDKDKPVSVPDDTRLKYECVKIREFVDARKYRTGESVMTIEGKPLIRDLKVLKDSFLEMSGMVCVEQLARLTEHDLIEMTKNYPSGSARLILDLMDELYTLRVRNKMQADALKAGAEDRGAK